MSQIVTDAAYNLNCHNLVQSVANLCLLIQPRYLTVTSHEFYISSSYIKNTSQHLAASHINFLLLHVSTTKLIISLTLHSFICKFDIFRESMYVIYLKQAVSLDDHDQSLVIDPWTLFSEQEVSGTEVIGILKVRKKTFAQDNVHILTIFF